MLSVHYNLIDMVNQAGLGYNVCMEIFAIIVFVLVVCLLLVVAGVVPRRVALSIYELERRRDSGNSSAISELKRAVLLEDVLSLKQVIESLLLVLFVPVSIWALGWLIGIISAVSLAIYYGRISRIEFIHMWSDRLMERVEGRLLQFIERHPTIFAMIRAAQPLTQNQTSVGSRDEFEHITKNSGSILTEQEKKLIINGMHFDQKRVEEVMTPRGVISSIEKNEVIGPLTLNDLHSTGHSRFPVIDGGIDHVIGVLHVQDLLALKIKDSQSAEKAMEPKVFYINQDQTLAHALAAFLKTRHHLFIVVNGYRETAGILTLEDCIEALIGRKIVDEFDLHDDLRVVAARSAKENNNPPYATNV